MYRIAPLLLLFLAVPLHAQTGKEWPFWGGDPGVTKYSTLTQLNRDNVAQLQPAWTWQTGERPLPVSRQPIKGQDVGPGPFEATPLVINDTMYLSTSFNRVVALDATTGKELWAYDPRAYEWGDPPNGSGFVHRGVATWTDGKERRIFLNTRWELVALDASTGKPIPSFGYRGKIDITEDLIWPVNRLHYTQTSAPVVYKDLVVLGNGVWDGFVYKNDVPGDVQAFDARTGRRVWRFSPIPQEGEFGTETWEEESWRYTGHTNVWAPISLDMQRGILYLPVGTPSNDYYGGHRKGDNLFAESVVALDADTGKRLWHFQTVHHGLWDYDLPAAPTLGTVTVDGRKRDIVAAAGKTGFLYVFDRVTGEPIWPIEERPVPQSDVPGEQTSPTQPIPTKPAAFAKQGFTEADVIDFTPELKAMALETIKGYRLGPLFTPPSVEGTIQMPGITGGTGWGGPAFDPETGWIYVKGNNTLNLIRVTKPDLKVENRVGHQPPEADYALDRATSRGIALPNGLPLNKPPYGTLTAIDLNTGEHVWQVPVGDMLNVRFNPALRGVELPKRLGAVSTGGPTVTKGGLIFLASGTILYAIDKKTGEVLWEHNLGTDSRANPITYLDRNGRQMVVVAAGSGANAKLMAFAVKSSATR